MSENPARFSIFSIYTYIHTLSIDIVLGVLSSVYFASKIFNLNVPVVWYIILGLGVWILYTLDHITDAITFSDNSIPKKYLFYKHHKKLLLIFVIGLSLPTIFLLFLLPEIKVLYAGLIAGFWVIFYYTTNKFLPKTIKRFFPKEVMIAIGYTLGIFIVPSLYATKVFAWQIIVILIFWLLTCTNVLVFSIYDYETDVKHNWHGLAHFLNKKQMDFLCKFLLLLTLLSILILMFHYNKITYGIILLSMLSILFWVTIHKSYFTRRNLYCIVADFIFIIPGAILLIFNA